MTIPASKIIYVQPRNKLRKIIKFTEITKTTIRHWCAQINIHANANLTNHIFQPSHIHKTVIVYQKIIVIIQ